MPDTAKPYVWLQAASDAEMLDHATVIQIIISGSGASATHPLIVVDNGWTYPHGTQVILGNVGGGSGNEFLRGGTFLISDTPASGNTSYFGTGVNYSHPNGTVDYVAGTASGTGNFAKLRAIEDGSSNFAFYITDLDGTDLGSNVTATTDMQGVASVILEDGDPRKVYGLPYHFVSHDGFTWPVVGADWNESTYSTLGNMVDEDISFTEGDYPWTSTTIKSPINFYTNWSTPRQNGNLQSGKNLNEKNLSKQEGNQGISGNEGVAREIFNYRTKWDWIAEHTGSPSEWPDDQTYESKTERNAISGYGFGDPTTLFKRANAKVWRVGAGSTSGASSTHWGAEIEFDSDHHLEVGQTFTTRSMNDLRLPSLDVTISADNTGSDTTVSSVNDKTAVFRVKFVIGPRCIRTYETKGTVGGVDYSKFVTVNVGQLVRFDLYGSRALVVSNGSITHSDEYMNTPSRLPTTTRFQLHAESIRHAFSDNVSVAPMVKSGGRSSIYEQLQMLGVNVGMRSESIEISGTLVDRGLVSASNLRKQIFLNIARTQWLKIMGFWGGKKKNELDDGGFFGTDNTRADVGYTHKNNDENFFMSKGLGYASTLNPRSYACLTIFNPAEQSSTDGKKVDVNPDGGYNIYRGIIKSLSFSEEGGRPNILTWRMSFEIISNEKVATSLLMDRD